MQHPTTSDLCRRLFSQYNFAGLNYGVDCESILKESLALHFYLSKNVIDLCHARNILKTSYTNIRDC